MINKNTNFLYCLIFFSIIISLLTLIYCSNILQMGRLHDNFVGLYTVVSICITYYYTIKLLIFFYDLITEKLDGLNIIFQANTVWGLLECIGNGLYVVTGDFKNGEYLNINIY